LASPSTIAGWIRSEFPANGTRSVEEAVEAVLLAHGESSYSASAQSLDVSDSVLGLLRSNATDNVTFAFSPSDPRRLVGKARVRSGDPEVATRVRARISLLFTLREALAALNPCDFERLCASLMTLNGAVDSHAGCASGDGGIDIYGRIAIREYAAGLPSDLLSPLFLGRRPILFLGQCKAIGVGGSVGRPALAQFRADAASCLAKYAGAKKAPPHRVPATYYVTAEPVVTYFFTTGEFSADATGSDVALQMTLVDGRSIAEALLFHAIGFMDSEAGPTVSQEALKEFASAGCGT
jgi:hypothetical protein